jgi:hypothetical protein
MSDRSKADFAPLGEMEIERASDIFRGCEFIRTTASTAGLIIAQYMIDVEHALQSVPVVDPGGWRGIGEDNPLKRARRVARHGHRAAEAMRAVGLSAAKLPPAYLKAYADVINARKDRKTFDPRGL